MLIAERTRLALQAAKRRGVKLGKPLHEELHPPFLLFLRVVEWLVARRCGRIYGMPRELLLKGIERVYLSEEEKKSVVKSIRVSTKPDQTSPNLDPLCQYYADTLRRTTIDQQAFDELEIPVGGFRRLYPKVKRHQQGRLDLKLGPKEGRLYSVYLHAPKVFRKLLRLDGKPMVEGEV